MTTHNAQVFQCHGVMMEQVASAAATILAAMKQEAANCSNVENRDALMAMLNKSGEALLRGQIQQATNKQAFVQAIRREAAFEGDAPEYMGANNLSEPFARYANLVVELAKRDEVIRDAYRILDVVNMFGGSVDQYLCGGDVAVSDLIQSLKRNEDRPAVFALPKRSPEAFPEIVIMFGAEGKRLTQENADRLAIRLSRGLVSSPVGLSGYDVLSFRQGEHDGCVVIKSDRFPIEMLGVLKEEAQKLGIRPEHVLKRTSESSLDPV